MFFVDNYKYFFLPSFITVVPILWFSFILYASTALQKQKSTTLHPVWAMSQRQQKTNQSRCWHLNIRDKYIFYRKYLCYPKLTRNQIQTTYPSTNLPFFCQCKWMMWASGNPCHPLVVQVCGDQVRSETLIGGPITKLTVPIVSPGI